jgi:ferredoxin
MDHSIALNFEDGVTRFVECRPDETIADASYRVGINIPLDCRDGVCGTCKCRVESGKYDRGDYLADALTEEEAAEGLALACQTRPRTDLVVAVAASSVFCKTGGRRIGRGFIRSTGSPRPRLRSRWIGRMRSASCPANTSTSWCRAPTSDGPIPSAHRQARRFSASWCATFRPG